jgi:putative molybdopterin biosynthesis protein
LAQPVFARRSRSASRFAPWTRVRPIGEDIVATEAIVPKRRRLGPAELAAIASGGVVEVSVVRLPRVAIVTTGDELVDPAVACPQRGAIVDSNSVLLAAAVRRYGGMPVRYPRIADDPALLAAAVDEAIAACDVVIVNAGSSTGRHRLHVAHFRALRRGAGSRRRNSAGPSLGFGTGVRTRGSARPAAGDPGYPVSAAICAELFLAPLIERAGAARAPDTPIFEVTLTRKVFSPLGEDEFIRVVAARVGERVVAIPLRRGAGVITSLSRAKRDRDDFALHRRRASRHDAAGARALRGVASIDRTLLAVGSHDVAIDLLAGALADRGLELVSANVGSIAGLVALRTASTHVAGTHVLDAPTGTYNDAAVRRYIPAARVALIAFAQREQGLIVARGNPLGLNSLSNVVVQRARYVNRQRDAGTRMLLDALLARDGLTPDGIDGYDRLEFTHLAVAALVADGSADCGLGIYAAARALGCDFVPIATEPYEIAVLAEALDDPRIQTLIAAMREPALRAAIDALGGYDAARAGDVRIVESA